MPDNTDGGWGEFVQTQPATDDGGWGEFVGGAPAVATAASPWAGAEAYASSLPQGHPDRAGVENWVSLAKQGNSDAVKFLAGTNFPVTANPAATSQPSGDTSKPYTPPTMAQSFGAGLKAGATGAMSGINSAINAIPIPDTYNPADPKLAFHPALPNDMAQHAHDVAQTAQEDASGALGQDNLAGTAAKVGNFAAGSAGYLNPFTAPVQAFGSGRESILAATSPTGQLADGDNVKANYVGVVAGVGAALAPGAGGQVARTMGRVPNLFRDLVQGTTAATAFMAPQPIATATVAGNDQNLQQMASEGIQELPGEVAGLTAMSHGLGVAKALPDMARGLQPAAGPMAEAAAKPDTRPGREKELSSRRRERQKAANDARDAQLAGEPILAAEDIANPIESDPHPLLDQGPVPDEVVQRKSFPPAPEEGADPAPYRALNERVKAFAKERLGYDEAKAAALGDEYEHAKVIEDGLDPSELNQTGRAQLKTEKELPPVEDPYDKLEREAIQGEPAAEPAKPALSKDAYDEIVAENKKTEVVEKPAEAPKSPEVKAELPVEAPAKPAVDAVKPVEPKVVAEEKSVAPAKAVAEVVTPPPKAKRGEVKGRLAEKALFGEVREPVKAPETFAPSEARIFKDAGKTAVRVRELPSEGVYLMAHESGKVLIGKATDNKGRPVENLRDGTSELRPVDVRGQPTSVDASSRTSLGKHNALVFNSIEEAAKYAVNHFSPDVSAEKAKEAAKMAAPSGEAEAGELARTELRVGASNKGEKELRSDLKKHLDEYHSLQATAADSGRAPTDAETKRMGDLVDKINQAEGELSAYDKPAEEPKAAAPVQEKPKAPVENSPLTPKLVEDLQDSLKPDMHPNNVGVLVKNVLEEHLNRAPHPQEIRSALADLNARGIITDDQVKATLPGKAQVFKGFIDPGSALLAATLPVMGIHAKRMAHDIITHAASDLPDWVGAHVDRVPKLQGQKFGARGKVVGDFIARTLLRGPMGPKLSDALQRMGHLFQARFIAALHPEFRPVLDRVRDMIDGKRQAFVQAHDAISGLESLEGESKERVAAALVQFRVEHRPDADFGKKFSFIDDTGRKIDYTLTKEEVNQVNQVYDANRKLLDDYAGTMLNMFHLPRNMTAQMLEDGIKNGTIVEAARMILEPLRTLENAQSNYVPFVRYGGYKRAVAYDMNKYRVAKTAEQRHDAMIGYIKAEGAADYEAKMKDFVHKFPTAKIIEFQDGPQDVTNASAGIKEESLRALAKLAGVPDHVFKDFWDAGVGEAIRTQGLRARFREASMVPGMSLDMARVNAEHALKMTNAVESMKFHGPVKELIDGMKDLRLKDYAKRLVMRVDSPPPSVATNIRHAAVLYYMGLAPVTGALNMSQSLLFSPISMGLATRSPLVALKHFGVSLRAASGALTYALGVPHAARAMKLVPGGFDMVEWAARHYKGEPALAAAIRDAHEKGTFSDSLIRNKEMSALGKPRNWIDKGSDAMMHFFSKTEQANRIATFVAAFRTWESHKGDAHFQTWAENMGFDGKNGPEFARWYSDLQNNRMDRSDAPEWAQGSFTKGKDGQQQFNPETWRQAAYALKSWVVDFMHLKMMEARAAWKGGWIDRSLYAAVTAGLATTLGVPNLIPGFNVEDAIEKAIERNPETTQDKIARSSPMGRVAMKGLGGTIAEAITGSHKLAEAVESLSARIGPGNLIPVGTITDILPVVGMGHSWVKSLGELSHPQTGWDRAESAAGLVGNEAKRLVRGARMLTTDDGYRVNGKTVVPDASKAIQGAPALTTMDKIGYMAGVTPPQVTHQYELKAAAQTMKTADDPVFNNFVQQFSQVARTRFETDEERTSAIQPIAIALTNYNKQVLADHEPWKLVMPDALARAIKQNVLETYTGNVNLKMVPKQARPELYREMQQLQSGDEVK